MFLLFALLLVELMQSLGNSRRFQPMAAIVLNVKPPTMHVLLIGRKTCEHRTLQNMAILAWIILALTVSGSIGVWEVLERCCASKWLTGRRIP
jgi:hypothetical protein